MAERCWYEPKYVCRNSADESILSEAESEYGGGYEYGIIGRGIDWDLDGLKEINCWQLVSYTLERLGYHAPSRWTWGDHSAAFGEYFCPVPYEKAQKGDIILFAPNEEWLDSLPWYWPLISKHATHVGIVSSINQRGSEWGGLFFSALNYDLGITDWVWKSNQEYPPFTSCVYGIYRPKIKVLELKCKDLNPPAVAFAIWIRDPLLLDLDGGGIKTVGLNAGVHFDHDKNGHKELTGWVAPGDGVLMLDMNGNGRLDSGRELFGGMTILPNGVTAANGFQALAFYDANGDGKIIEEAKTEAVME